MLVFFMPKGSPGARRVAPPERVGSLNPLGPAPSDADRAAAPEPLLSEPAATLTLATHTPDLPLRQDGLDRGDKFLIRAAGSGAICWPSDNRDRTTRLLPSAPCRPESLPGLPGPLVGWKVLRRGVPIPDNYPSARDGPRAWTARPGEPLFIMTSRRSPYGRRYPRTTLGFERRLAGRSTRAYAWGWRLGLAAGVLAAVIALGTALFPLSSSSLFLGRAAWLVLAFVSSGFFLAGVCLVEGRLSAARMLLGVGLAIRVPP
jgi:hypothetical protein